MKVSKNSTMTVTIRKATKADLPEILKIVNHAILNTTANYDYEPHTLEMQTEWFTDKIANGFPVIVTEYRGSAVGFATYGTFRQKFGYRFTVEHSVYVSDEFTGNGIGSQLLTKLISLATTAQLHTMVGVIDKANTESIAFHERFGFTESGVIKDVAFKFGKWLDVSVMQLILPSKT